MREAQFLARRSERQKMPVILGIGLGDGEVDGFSFIQAGGHDVLHESRRAPPSRMEDEGERAARCNEVRGHAPTEGMKT